ncbi:2-hydroxyacyl-CoA dehydratase subunit D [Thermodesulfobacteriota bacterium]
MDQITFSSRIERARELHRQGSKIVGYFCCYTPIELITAAGLVPFHLTGAMDQPAVQADGFIETVICPYIRSVFEMRINGDYDFIDGLVMGNTCDTIYFSYTAFKDYWKPAFSHFLDIPHKITESSRKFHRSEFDRFRDALAGYTEIKISDESLQNAIVLHNRNRQLLRELYELRKDQPPPMAAGRVLETSLNNRAIPVEEGNKLLEDTIAGIVSARPHATGSGKRLLLWGSQFNNTQILDIIEDCGASVVVDDLCMGYRNIRQDVEVTSEPMDGLTTYYSSGQVCARTYRDGVDERFGHIKELARDFRVDGAILYLLRYCDPCGFDLPLLKAYIENTGIPAMVIEDDYTGGARAQITTRIQAFVEMLEQR